MYINTCISPHEHDITFLLQSYETSFVIHIMHLNIKAGLCDIKIKGIEYPLNP